MGKGKSEQTSKGAQDHLQKQQPTSPPAKLTPSCATCCSTAWTRKGTCVQLVSGVMPTPTMFSQGRCSVFSAGPTTQCVLRVVWHAQARAVELGGVPGWVFNHGRGRGGRVSLTMGSQGVAFMSIMSSVIGISCPRQRGCKGGGWRWWKGWRGWRLEWARTNQNRRKAVARN